MALNCCMQILRRVVNPLRVCLAPLWLCLTAAADDSSAFDVNPPRLPSDEIAQISLSTQNDQNDYTRLPPVANFDVFINHRGKDVKDTLASHIYDLLQIHGVRAFLDREELPTGDAFPDAITEAIQSSSVHIAIFSPHYAESSWCLRELALMLKTPNATIIPVFYNVKPEELRWAKGAFAKAFDKHYRRYSQEMVDEWRAALQEVSNISGLSLSDFKGRLATKVVQEVLKRIKSEPLTVDEFPVGLEKPVARLREYIIRCRMEKTQVGFVGIIGIAGIGKTTLAKALYNNINCDLNFKSERATFIEDIKGEAEKKGLQEVRRKLLQNLLHHDYQVLDLSQSQGQQIIRERLNNMDALIVLDNIEHGNQLNDILFPEILSPGSTVIVTSRDSSIFNRRKEFLKYEMPGLNLSESKELFCQHAFVTGVACISFNGEEIDTIKRIWEEESEDSADSSTDYDLQILERKCMIQRTCIKLVRGLSGLVTMHEAFRDLGRAIVDEESPTNPGGRSRLWRPNDVKKVLKNCKGTEKVRGLSLVFGGSVIRNQDRFGRPCAWPADAFANMKELKLLQLRDDCVEGDLQKLPQGLVWLRWQNYPYECMPPNLNDARVLDFCGGKLVSLWDDQSQELNLRRCYKLQRVPDSIGIFRALQKLDFSECSLLKTLSEEFCYLESLEVLRLNGCLNLEHLPSGFGGMRRLRHVSLKECKKLKALPESFGLLPQIEYLDMTDCTNVKIEEGSFGSISTLKEVYLLNCRKLETFPTQLTRQRSLKKLGVAPVDEDSRRIVGFGHNEIFIDIPENIGDLSKLTELRLGNLMGIPQSIGNLSHLVRFHLWGLANMRAIPDSIGLKNLCLLECPQLEGLQTCIGNLSCLSNLYLRDCPRLQELPTSIGNLSCLSELHLSNCPRLQELPTSIGNLSCLSELSLWNCPRLQELPTSIGNLSCLSSLILSNCSRLQELPTSIGNLSCLSSLQLWDCPRLQELPTSIGNLSCLSELHLSNCPRLQQLPTSMGNLSCLSQFRLWNCPRLQELPTSIGNLSCLSELRLSNCPRLQELPTSIGNLSCLSELQLLNCPRLQELPTSIGNLSCLSELQLLNCPRLQELPTSIGNLSCLSRLELWDCPRLQELPTSIGNLCCLSRLQLLDLPLTDSFLTEENSVLLKNLISPSLEFTFTASAIPYPTAWLDAYHFQMMSKRDSIPFVSGSSGLKCSLPAATTKECAAIIICFVSVTQLIDELNDNQLAARFDLHFQCKNCFGSSGWHNDFSYSKLGDTIHLKILSVDDMDEINVFMNKYWSSSVKGYLKYGWIKIIRKGEEDLIQQICGDFFRELRRQRPLAVARASAASLLDLGNVHALDIANCTIRRTLYLDKTPIQEENMDLVLRKKQLFWRDDKELEHLDLSIMNSTSIPLFLTLKSMVNLYNMEVIISNNRSVEAYKDEFQEYQDNSVIKSHANIPVQVAKILKSRNKPILEVK